MQQYLELTFKIWMMNIHIIYTGHFSFINDSVPHCGIQRNVYKYGGVQEKRELMGCRTQNLIIAISDKYTIFNVHIMDYSHQTCTVSYLKTVIYMPNIQLFHISCKNKGEGSSIQESFQKGSQVQFNRVVPILVWVLWTPPELFQIIQHMCSYVHIKLWNCLSDVKLCIFSHFLS